MQRHVTPIRSRRRARAARRVSAGFALAPLALAALVLAQGAQALPTGVQTVVGTAQVTQPDANTMVVTTGQQQTIVNAQTFGIGAQERLTVNQPGSTSTTMFAVQGYDPSYILGQLQSNGRVFLQNPNGIVFGANARVDVGGLVATTLHLSDADFLAGRYLLTDTGNGRGDLAGRVINQGSINATGGAVVLAGADVLNSGTIQADGGRVGLIAARKVLVDVEGDGLLFFEVDGREAGARLRQLGRIQADGGSVELMAASRGQFADTVLNMSGVVQARTLGLKEGRVVIDGGTSGVTLVSGSVDASGRGAGETGGTVTVLGDKVGLVGAARIDASGDAGGGTVLVGGDAHGAGERRASSTYVGAGVSIDASATTRGNGGKVVVWADGATRFLGRINARGGLLGGNGGFAEVSGARHLDYLGLADLSAPSGAKGLLLLDPSNIEIVARTADANKTGAATPAAAPDNDLLATDDASSDPGLQFFATSGAADSVSKISAGAVVAQLDTADVQLAATHDITVSAAIDASANANSHGLTLTAGSGASDAVILKADVISKGGLVLQGRQIQVADNDVTLDAGSGKLSLEAAVDGGGKSLSLVSGNGAADAVKTGGAIGNVAALTVTGKSTLGGSVTTTGAQRYSGLVTLGTAGAYTFAGSALSFNGLAAGANDLVFRADSALVVTGALSGTGHVSIAGQSADRALSVGGPTASPDDLEISNSTLALFGTGFAGVSIGRADGTGAITFADYTLTRDLSVRNGTGAIRFGRLDGGFALTAQTDGIITLGGDIGTSSATRSLDFNGAVALAQSVTIKADSVSFGATVDSADATPRGLTLNAPTGVRFGGAVGQTHALAALDVSSAETRVAGDVTVAAGGHQVYSGNVVLDGDATFKAPTLTFGGSVAAGDHDLGVLADSPVLPAGGMTGNKRLTVGAFTDSTTIGVDGGAGTLQVATSGGFTRVTVGSATGTGEINLGATGGAAVDLSKDLTLQSASGNINVNTQVDGAHSLTLTTGGVVTIGAGVGGNTALTALTTGGAGGTTRLNANVTTSGDQTYGHAVVIGTTVRTQAGSTEAPATVRFASTVDSASGGAGSLTVTGNARFDAAVGAVQRLASLSVSGAAQLGGNISTTGSQTYVGAVTLGQAVSLDSSSSYIYFPAGSSVDGAFDLTLTSASASYLYGSVGATTPLGSLTVNGLAYVSAAAVNTSGAQTYASLVTAFNSSTTFTGSDVAFNGGLSSSGDVNVDASGTATVGGASVSVANLGVSHAALINTASVTTTGAQTYGGDVTLGATTTVAGNTIRFNGTVRAAANGAQGLTVNDSGTTTFTGDVGGGGHALASLTTSAGGKTVLPGQVTTTGAQSYGDVAQLAVATTLQAGSVRFDAGLLGGNQGLTVSLPTAGTLLFKVSVADLGGLVVDGDATTLTSFDGTGGLATSGEQRYGGAVAILDGGDARFVASALRFGGKVSGARNLVLNADTIAAGELAGTGELQVAPSSAGRSIDLTGGAADVSIDLNRVSGFTQRTIGRADGTGAITAGALHLGGDTTVQSGTGNLNFNGAIDGPYALTAQTGGGVAFGGDIGGDPANPLGPKALSRLNVSSGQALTLGKVYLSGGGTIQTAGQLELTDKLQLDGGTLTLASTAAPGAGSAIIDADGKPSDQLLLDNRPLREAAAAISQTGGAVVTAAGTTLDLRASGGGSIVVDSAANDIKGNLSAVSGTPGEAGGARFALGATPLVLGAIRLQSSQMHAAGIEGDVVRLTAGSLNTVAGTKIRARLPYVNAQGALTSMPALTLVPTQPALVNQFGAAASSSWIQVEVGDATGGYLTVRPKGAGAGSSAVYLGGADGLVPFYDGAGKASEIQVYYNGRTPSTPQEVGALSAVTSVIEESRRSRFEEVVRTENVSARLRTGVIAEVGSGRPATVGSESIRLPASCTPNNRLGC